MSERPTPETDAVSEMLDFKVDLDFARKLERERDEARELADRYRIALCSVNGMDKTPTPFPWEATQ